MLKKPKAQTTAEYAIIFAVVISAAVAMQTYVKRGLQARQKTTTDALVGISQTFAAVNSTASDANFSAVSQYEPYYLESENDRYQETVEQEHMGQGKVIKEKVSDISTTASGGFQKQATMANKVSRDGKWK